MLWLWLLPAAAAVVGSALVAAVAAETARQARETLVALRTTTTTLRSDVGQVRDSLLLARSRGDALTRRSTRARPGPTVLRQ